ncbi:unnamed protein product [Sphagnum troendelagicum]|uniref:Uncharacterized protein n=1 Tax=Sphagnum troendelagicum TaxID=128251 RepID=A0ABP0V2F3_9BRYO
MTDKKGTPFQKAHTLDFALEIVSMDVHGDVTVWFMDVKYIKWRAKLINVSTDGENTMTGRHVGVVTRLVDCTDNDVLRDS